MRSLQLIFCSLIIFLGIVSTANAQTLSCLKYQSNSTPPGGYGVSWDVTSSLKELLVKSNCPTSGNSLDITIGKGSATQYIWGTTYVYGGTSWTAYTLTGTSADGGWLIGQGNKTVTQPFTPTPANPLFFVGYVCTPVGSTWKCGCANASCTTKNWQLQGYMGAGGGGGGGAHRSGLPWKSGSSPGTDFAQQAQDKTAGFGAWRGRLDDVAVIFIGSTHWNSYQTVRDALSISSNGGVKGLIDAGIDPVLGVPLLIPSDFMNFSLIASGARDDEHQAIADQIHSIVGNKLVYIRIGWETDEGYPWSYTNHSPPGTPNANPAEYKAAWHRIALIYKNTIPNAKLVWNLLKNTRLNQADYYPGDDVVDIVSVDVYDGYGNHCNTAALFNEYCLGSYNPATGQAKALGLLKFAKAHGKKFAVDEWGTVNATHTPGDVGNNSVFVSMMYDFFAENSDWIEYESYFNRAGGGDHQIWPRVDYNGLVSDAYLAKWHP